MLCIKKNHETVKSKQDFRFTFLLPTEIPFYPTYIVYVSFKMIKDYVLLDE